MPRFGVAFIFSLLVLAVPLSSADARDSYFEMTERRSTNLKPFPKWNGMVHRYGEESKIPDSECDKVSFHPCDAISEWRGMISGLRDKSYHKQLETVNDWANKHPYIIDQINWGMNDYWETPFEFMTVSGDCEDYAIAKYYSLRALGIEAEQLRIIIVQDLNLGGIIHAVLAAYEDDDMLILDNQSPSIRSAYAIYHYRPIYGINENAWWILHPKNDS